MLKASSSQARSPDTRAAAAARTNAGRMHAGAGAVCVVRAVVRAAWACAPRRLAWTQPRGPSQRTSANCLSPAPLPRMHDSRAPTSTSQSLGLDVYARAWPRPRMHIHMHARPRACIQCMCVACGSLQGAPGGTAPAQQPAGHVRACPLSVCKGPTHPQLGVRARAGQCDATRVHVGEHCRRAAPALLLPRAPHLHSRHVPVWAVRGSAHASRVQCTWGSTADVHPLYPCTPSLHQWM
jgi:hypothetical protein